MSRGGAPTSRSGSRAEINYLDSLSATSLEDSSVRLKLKYKEEEADSGTVSGGEGLVSTKPACYQISTSELIALTSFNFPYGLICGTMGLCILPAESQRLFPGNASICLGVFLVLVGLSQLACPVSGKASDLYVAPWAFGKRAPFLFYSTIIAVVSVGGMCVSSLWFQGWAYCIFLLLGMIALNVFFSVQCGLVPDFGDDRQEGRSSGAVAASTLLGSGLGFGIMIVASRINYHWIYLLYAALSLISCVMVFVVSYKLQNRLTICRNVENPGGADDQDLKTGVGSQDSIADFVVSAGSADANSCFGCDHGGVVFDGSEETSKHHQGGEPMSNALMTEVDIIRQLTRISWTNLSGSLHPREIMRAYYSALRGDFFWVFIGRTLYYVAVSVQAFILFFLRDVVGTVSEQERITQVGIIALSAQCVAAVVAFPIGRMTDKSLNRKPLVYVACAAMALTYLLFMISPLFGEWAYDCIWLTSLLYGAGNGCFLAVDYALALMTMPDKSKSAESLGLWGISAFIGSALGPLLWGTLIEWVGNDDGKPGYSYLGYVVMLTGGIIATLLSGLVIKRLRTVK